MHDMGDMSSQWHALRSILARQSDAGKQLLKLLDDPFKQSLGQGAIWSAVGTSIGFTVFIALAFSFLRPYNSVVYAPKLKHADEKHAPPDVGKGYLDWVMPVWKTTEEEMIGYAGLDAAIFMRFTIMCRNIFVVLSLLGCGILLPINWTRNKGDRATQVWYMRITPNEVWDADNWGLILVAYLVTIIVCGFLWCNYRKVLQLRRIYFEGDEYQQSLHARTLMLTDIPKTKATDEGIARIIDEVAPRSSFSRTAAARNVKELPSLIRQHDGTVRELEKVLARYLKDPHNLPASRPLCYPSKKDPSYDTYPRGQKIDAIDYLTQRIRELEVEVKQVRLTVDKRNTLSYGFASYDDIAEAHFIAFSLRRKKPQGATVRLAPRPNDIIWDNMPLSPAVRSWRAIMVNIWISILTVLWIAPNAMIAVFLVNLTNLGLVWPAFQAQLSANNGFWSMVQGVASPAITSLVYLVLPIIFRRLSVRAGDRTKTGRERHVIAKLYAFFVFNNLLVFSLFSTIWSFTATIIDMTNNETHDAWESILKADFANTLFTALCQISPFWITWLLQRSLGAAIDLAQLWPLMWSFLVRKLSNPTPRELIELTAPPAFDYASYFNFFLYYSTVALCYYSLQPLVLPAAALYFTIDVWLKKYLLLYVFITKTESGGVFWKVVFNRFIFALLASNVLVFLVVWCRGDLGLRHQPMAVIPLPLLILVFKLYCARTFDTKVQYYATRLAEKHYEGVTGSGKNPLRSDRLAARFGHPALYKPLVTPMVHAKAQNILASVYQGRLTDGRDADSGDETTTTTGYSDSYVLDSMKAGTTGKKKSKGLALPGFEIVPEHRLDFQYYKNRDEFAFDHGGGGGLYGRNPDIVRPGTPGSVWGGSEPVSRPPSPSLPPRIFAPVPHPYEATDPARMRNVMYGHSNDSGHNLVGNAAFMPSNTPVSREHSVDLPAGVRAHGVVGMMGSSSHGYGGLPQTEDVSPEADHDPMTYDYFRNTSSRRSPGSGW